MIPDKIEKEQSPYKTAVEYSLPKHNLTNNTPGAEPLDTEQQETMESILNGMDALITVCDPKTFKILFINNSIRDYFGIHDSSVGKLCYEVLQKRDAPCIGCPYQQLLDEPDAILHWEHREFVRGSILQKTARLIDWPGRTKAHLEYAVDVTPLVLAEEKLERRGRMLDSLNLVSKIFLSQNEETFADIMAEGFASIADITNLGRMSVSRNTLKPDGLYASQIYRWSREAGTSSAPLHELQELPYAKSIPRWGEVLKSDECINGPISLMPEADTLFQLGCVSVLAVPVFEKGIFWGFVLFEDLSEERVFNDDEVDILRSAGFMLVNAITRHERNEKIKAADEHTKLMLDATPLSCILWDAAHKAIDCNTAAVELYGFSSKEECIARIGESLPQYQPDGSLSVGKAVSYLDKAFQEGSCHFDWTHITPEGELVPTSITFTRVKYGSGYLAAGYATDLRDRRLLMGEIARQNVLLQAVNHLSSTMLSSKAHTFDQDILRSMKIMAEAMNMDRVFLCKNDDADGGLSYTQFREWTDRSGSDNVMAGIPSLSEHCLLSLAENKCISGITENMPPQVQKRLAGRGVKSVIIVPVFLYGEFWGFVGFEDWKNERVFYESEENILRASSELLAEAFVRHEMEENLRNSSIELLNALVEAKAANSAKSEFLSSMSHEMRTPLNAVIGMAAIGKKADDKERKNYALDKIEEASTHLLGVINDILDMSKIEAGKVELSPVSFNLEHMLQKVIAVVNSRIIDKNQHFTIHIDNDVPLFLIGDDQRISQIITNLLSNATKFTPEHGQLSLTISLLKTEGTACEIQAKVADSGIGISIEQQSMLFQPFVQADSGTTREYGGTGLGLSIVKRLVEMMDGQIRVESELGKGAHFIFTLKLLIADSNFQSLLRPDISWDSIRVWAAGSTDAFCQNFRDAASRLCLPCDTAYGRDEIRRTTEENGPYDICFLDRCLTDIPHMELDLVRRIKSHSGGSCKVILVSPADGEQLQETVRDAGADMGMTQPIFASTLANCMNHCFADSEENQIDTSGGEFTGKALLLAEDIEINQEIIVSLLEGTGLAIDCVENGKEALNRMESEPDKYDILFMDMQMPTMDGLEATRRIRALPADRCRQIPIVAMTANVFKADVERCMEAGMNDHIGKPIDFNIVMKKLRKYLL